MAFSQEEFANYLVKQKENGITDIYFNRYSQPVSDAMGAPSFSGCTVEAEQYLAAK